MRTTTVAMLAAVTALAAATLLSAASAAYQDSTCSGMTHEGAAGDRTYFLEGENPGHDCGSVAGTAVAGGLVEFSFVCTETGVPPTEPQSSTIRFFPDDSQENAPESGTPILSVDVTAVTTACNGNANAVNFYCTDNGLVGGSPRYGLVRLVILASRTTVPTYAIDTDDGGTPGTGNSVTTPLSGVVRCSPKPSAYTDGNPTTSPSVYVAGDTIRTSITVNAAPYATPSGTLAEVRVLCGASLVVDSSVRPTTSAVTGDILIKGTVATFPDDCSLIQRVVATTGSGLAGLSAVKVLQWDSTSPISGVTFPDASTAQRTAKNLDRTLSDDGSCDYYIDLPGGSAHDLLLDGSVANRGEDVHSSDCGWADARGTAIVNNARGRGFLSRAATPYTTTDFPSEDTTFTTGGDLHTHHVASTSATVTTGLAYTKCVEAYGASYAAAELLGFGCDHSAAPAAFDVSATWTFDDVRTAKASGGVVARSFTIGTDLQFILADHLANARGESISGVAVTCVRRTPSGATETTQAMGSTNSNGDTAEFSFQTNAPQGTWTWTCTASGSGNSASRAQAISHLSAFTANQQIIVIPNGTTRSGDYIVLNVTVLPRLWDEATDDDISVVPDQPPRFNVESCDVSDGRYDEVAPRSTTQETSTGSGTWYAVVMVPSTSVRCPLAVIAVANITGRPFMGSAAVLTDFTQEEQMHVIDMTTLGATLAEYAPFLIWGVIMVFFAAKDAWFPYFTSMLALLTNLTDPPMMPLRAMVMLNIMAFALHILVTRGLMPRPRWYPSKSLPGGEQ